MATKQKDSAGDQATIPPLERKALTKISALVTRSTPLARHFYHGSTGSLISSGCAYLAPAETSPAHSSKDELLRDRPSWNTQTQQILEKGTIQLPQKFCKLTLYFFRKKSRLNAIRKRVAYSCLPYKRDSYTLLA